ncbi:MAG: transglutaminase-like domain-containing protein [Limnochordia bacterium]
MTSELLEYYRIHGPMTEIKTMQHMVANVPADIETIVRYVQNILVHQHWSSAYGVELTPEREREPLLRSFEEKLVFLSGRGFKHVSDEKPYQDRMIGICRDYSVAAAALCREAGIPARARCGFATYFDPGKYEDHWVLEYWNDAEQRWVMADAQLDGLQQEKLQITFNTLDLTDDHFLTGPKAWFKCRRGEVDPDLFGIFQWWGYGYVLCNLILDVNSLLKMPMQPWDGWPGYKILPVDEWTEADLAVIDELAALALAVDNDFQSFAQFVLGNDKIRVPSDLSAVFDLNE